MRADAAILVRGEEVHALKGKLTKSCLADVRAIVKEGQVRNGEIWFVLGAKPRILFSGGIPDRLHQRLRNTLLGTHVRSTAPPSGPKDENAGGGRKAKRQEY